MHQFYTPDITNNEYVLNEEESKHCIKVLRLKTGDTIRLLNGKGSIYIAQITDDHYKKCNVKIIETKNYTLPTATISIAIAPTKNMDRLEWFVEKTTEIGIQNIIPFTSKNSERAILKTERIQKVAISAIKQSMNPFLPHIHELIDFKKLIEEYSNFDGEKLIAHCLPPLSYVEGAEERSHLKNIYTQNKNALILIGPEGDFTKEEVDLAIANGFKEISLGKNRLRTETAALYVCVCINSINS